MYSINYMITFSQMDIGCRDVGSAASGEEETMTEKKKAESFGTSGGL